MSGREVKEYLSKHHVSRLLESLVTGLLYHRPDDPVSFLLDCLIATRWLGGPKEITWDAFIHPGGVINMLLHFLACCSTSCPPPPKAPPAVCSQLSIDSDSGMMESSGLLQEVTIQKPRPIIVFIIGGPGSGKGSQTARLTDRFGFRAISLDELLKQQLQCDASPSRRWEVISKVMSHGKLGPQEDTVSELRQQLIGQQDVRGFVVDGFPRDVHQALSFQEQVCSPDLVMLLLCSNEKLRCRLERRATQLGLLGDSRYALQRRLDRFEKDIVSVSRYYRQLHLLTQVHPQGTDSEFIDFSSLSHLISCF
uniref:Nucleoside-diphosphate kinase n=1 Tax=Oreochromis aureus TaxID=47969 RepID=A0A668T1D2_OREAU